MKTEAFLWQKQHVAMQRIQSVTGELSNAKYWRVGMFTQVSRKRSFGTTFLWRFLLTFQGRRVYIRVESPPIIYD